MKMIYIDSEYKCHIENAEGRTAAQTEYFDGKCDAYIEGYRFIPAGQTWTREDGVQFAGEMISPWKDYRQLDEMQREYERQQLEEARQALAILGVNA